MNDIKGSLVDRTSDGLPQEPTRTSAIKGSLADRTSDGLPQEPTRMSAIKGSPAYKYAQFAADLTKSLFHKLAYKMRKNMRSLCIVKFSSGQ